MTGSSVVGTGDCDVPVNMRDNRAKCCLKKKRATARLKGQHGCKVALSLYLQQTTQRRHTPGLPVTYGNTQTQVTERQTEDTGITHKRTTDKDWPKERTSTTQKQMKDKVLRVSVDPQRCVGTYDLIGVFFFLAGLF